MTAFVLDAGALIAVDRGDRTLLSRLRAATLEGAVLRTNALAIAQAWRSDDGRHARLSQLLRGSVVVPIGEDEGRAIGRLLGRAGTADVVDASVVLLCRHDDVLVTSYVDDLRVISDARGVRVTILTC